MYAGEGQSNHQRAINRKSDVEFNRKKPRRINSVKGTIRENTGKSKIKK